MLLIISNSKRYWHYLAIKNLSRLLRGIGSNHNSDFYCLNCFHSYRTAGSLKIHGRLCYDHDHCRIDVPSPGKNILKYNSGEKSLKLEHIITYDLEALLIKQYNVLNNLDQTYTEKMNTHEAYGYAINLVRENGENESVYYRGGDCMKKICEDLNDMVEKIINTPKKEMIPLTDEQITDYDQQKYYHICKKEFSEDVLDEKEYMKYRKVRDHCHYTGEYRGAAHGICNLGYSDQRIIPIIAHNGSNYDNNFIIKELARRFEGRIECLGESMEKYISFSVSAKFENNEKELVTYKLKFIDSKRFMNTSLQKLVDNMTGLNENDKEI